MKNSLSLFCTGVALASLTITAAASPTPQTSVPEHAEGTKGTRLSSELIGEGVVEAWEQVQQRSAKDTNTYNNRSRKGSQGEWFVPKPRATFRPHSGQHCITNKWGDTSMGIGFPLEVDVVGVWIAGQAGEGVWPAKIRVEGYRGAEKALVTDWFEDLDAKPQWLEINFDGVDRIVFTAEARIDGAAWYSLDDLTFQSLEGGSNQAVVLDFEDLGWGESLTGSGYSGLDWEVGAGSFDAMPAPGKITAVGSEKEDPQSPAVDSPGASLSPPTLSFTFEGIERGANNQFSFPPDSNGAVGPDHYVITVNRNIGIYTRDGVELSVVALTSFLPGAQGDSRLLFDHHSQRWLVVSTDFTDRIFLAISMTDDPTGDWFKASFIANSGSSHCAVDFPTLGLDDEGIYISASVLPNCGTRIWAIDKTSLLSATPSLDVITEFSGLPLEVVQPCLTHGNPGGEYLISDSAPGFPQTIVRLRRIDPPLINPTLIEVGFIQAFGGTPPTPVPTLGASTPIDTGDDRLGNAVYRDGSVYTSQTINFQGRAAVRWHEFSTVTNSLVQFDTVRHPSLSYYYPSIAVNANNDVLLGFSGSDANTSPSCYVAGRKGSDPAGETSDAVLYKAGSGASYTTLDSSGRNRWGDYSMTVVDPSDDCTFWTIQEYVKGSNIWGTWVAVVDSESDLLPDFYCTPKASSAFCLNVIGTSDSLAQPLSGVGDYSVTCSDVQGLKNGLLFASISGRASLPFNGGTLCVAPPTKRGPLMNSGGTGVNSCDGTYSTVVNDGAVIPFGLDAGSGNTAWYQYWYRDPQNGSGNSGSSLSNGVELNFQ